jgi:hypothetical protein
VPNHSDAAFAILLPFYLGKLRKYQAAFRRARHTLKESQVENHTA